MFTAIKISFLLIITLLTVFIENKPKDHIGIPVETAEETIKTANYPAENQRCLSCHTGIEPIRDHDSKMMKAISKGSKVGDPNGCVVCHFGDPSETKNKTLAHRAIPDGNVFIKATAVAGELRGLVPYHDQEHTKRLNQGIRWAAFTRIIFPIDRNNFYPSRHVYQTTKKIENKILNCIF